MCDRRRAPSAASWSELPPEILSSIGKRLKSRVGFFRFRSVCKNWRSSLNPNPNPNLLSSVLPRKISNPTLPFSNRRDDSLILVVRMVLLVQPLRQSHPPSYWFLNVEEINPGKLRILYPLSKDRVTTLSAKFPKYLSLLDFNVSELNKSYGFRFASDEGDVCGVDKVVLCSDCCTAMVLYGKGSLVGVRLKNGNLGYVRQSLITAFSDVINFKQRLYAIDFRGNVYVIDHKTMKVIKTIAVESSFHPSNRRYLVVSKGQLCSVCWYVGHTRERVEFLVYSLDEKHGPWVPITSPTFMILFMSCDSCFCINAKCFDDKYSNVCVVYAEHCLDSSAGRSPPEHKLLEAASVDLQLGIFFIRGNDESVRSKIIGLVTDMMWPPPAWFWPDTYVASGDEEENEELDFCTQHVPISAEALPPSLVVEGRIPTTDMPLVTIDVLAGEQALRANIPRMNINPVSGDSNIFKIQNFNHGTSGMTFEGLSIKSSLVPTLRKIWGKHGNIMENSTMRNRDMISRALESLVIVVLILKTNTGWSLSKRQADYLSSALSDLQQMNVKVGWLTPFVEKALAVLKSRPLIGSLKELGKVKARAEVMKSKVLDELAKLDEVEEDLTLILEKIPVLEEVDLNKCLGEGLY